MLQLHAIVIIQVVESDNFVATSQQSLCQVEPDKARSAGYQNFTHPSAPSESTVLPVDLIALFAVWLIFARWK